MKLDAERTLPRFIGTLALAPLFFSPYATEPAALIHPFASADDLQDWLADLARAADEIGAQLVGYVQGSGVLFVNLVAKESP